MSDQVSTGGGAGAATARDTATDLNYKLLEGDDIDSALALMTKADLLKMIRGAPNAQFYRHRDTGVVAPAWDGGTPVFDPV